MTEGATPMPQPRNLVEKVRDELEQVRSAGLSYEEVVGDFDHAVEQVRAEERRLVVREIRERFKDDAPTAATSTLAIRRILDEVAGER